MIKLLKFDKYSRHYDIILAKNSIVVWSDDGYYVFPPKIFAKSECEEPMSSDSRVPFYVFVKGACIQTYALTTFLAVSDIDGNRFFRKHSRMYKYVNG